MTRWLDEPPVQHGYLSQHAGEIWTIVSYLRAMHLWPGSGARGGVAHSAMAWVLPAALLVLSKKGIVVVVAAEMLATPIQGKTRYEMTKPRSFNFNGEATT